MKGTIAAMVVILCYDYSNACVTKFTLGPLTAIINVRSHYIKESQRGYFVKGGLIDGYAETICKLVPVMLL